MALAAAAALAASEAANVAALEAESIAQKKSVEADQAAGARQEVANQALRMLEQQRKAGVVIPMVAVSPLPTAANGKAEGTVELSKSTRSRGKTLNTGSCLKPKRSQSVGRPSHRDRAHIDVQAGGGSDSETELSVLIAASEEVQARSVAAGSAAAAPVPIPQPIQEVSTGTAAAGGATQVAPAAAPEATIAAAAPAAAAPTAQVRAPNRRRSSRVPSSAPSLPVGPVTRPAPSVPGMLDAKLQKAECSVDVSTFRSDSMKGGAPIPGYELRSPPPRVASIAADINGSSSSFSGSTMDPRVPPGTSIPEDVVEDLPGEHN